MKATCKITGIKFEIKSLPGLAPLGKILHPLLSPEIPIQTLHTHYLKTWAEGKLPAIETHLLAVAFILRLPLETNSTFPKIPPEKSKSFWDANMQALAKMAAFIESYSLVARMPKFRVSEDNLSNLPTYLKELELEIKSYTSPISEVAKRRNSLLAKGASYAEIMKGEMDVESTEDIIFRGLKGSPLSKKESRQFPALIATWAAHTANFPKAIFTHENGKRENLSDFWKRIIIHAFQPASKLLDILDENVSTADIEELLEHCYAELPVGSVHASELYKRLSILQEVLDEFRSGSVIKSLTKAIPNHSDNDLLAMLNDSSAPRASSLESSEQKEVKENSPYSSAEKLAQRLSKIKQNKGSN